jgi:hypothetical protein
MAAEMRRRAETADGADRDYFNWLANEWDRTAERDAMASGRGRPAPQLANA